MEHKHEITEDNRLVTDGLLVADFASLDDAKSWVDSWATQRGHQVKWTSERTFTSKEG